MNLLKMTPLAAALVASLLVGCQRREATAPGETQPGSTASAPGTGSPGTMGETPSTTPPATTSPPATTPPASAPSSTGSIDSTTPSGTGTAGGLAGSGATPTTTAGTGAPPSGDAGPGAVAGGPLNIADKTFVTKAAAGGMYEVEVAKLAVDKAHDPAVKSFATMLVDQHSAANAELKALAAMRDVKLPDEVAPDKKQVLAKLGKMSGAGFDKEFVKQVGIKDHESDIKLFESASRDAKDAQLKAWVEKTLPSLKEHLAAAQKLPGASS